jgi:hypothetical protein
MEIRFPPFEKRPLSRHELAGFFSSKNTMNRHLNIRLFNGTITNNAQFFRTVREEPVKHGDQGHIE